jgi:hypothetical protein
MTSSFRKWLEGSAARPAARVRGADGEEASRANVEQRAAVAIPALSGEVTAGAGVRAWGSAGERASAGAPRLQARM